MYELGVNEHQALHEFWHEAGQTGADRIAILRVFAEVAIVRPPEWDYVGVRAAAEANRHAVQLFAITCFACAAHEDRRTSLRWHHVIQIQYGGSNTARNRVALCTDCHAAVHPWLPQPLRLQPGWASLNDITSAIFTKRKEETA